VQRQLKLYAVARPTELETLERHKCGGNANGLKTEAPERRLLPGPLSNQNAAPNQNWAGGGGGESEKSGYGGQWQKKNNTTQKHKSPNTTSVV